MLSDYLIRIETFDSSKETELSLDTQMHERGFMRSTRISPPRVKEYKIEADLSIEEIQKMAKGSINGVTNDYTILVLDRTSGKSLFYSSLKMENS